MIIELENIGPRAKPIEASFNADALDLDVEGARLTSDVAFGGETQQVDGRSHLRGSITAEATVDCTRCLEPIAFPLDLSFDSVYVTEDESAAKDEVVLEGELLDESVAEDGKIDVAEAVREQILLALPEQLFCKEDCQGLCPKCGANRNLIDCNCEDKEIDPRWAALKDLI